jgi:tetratricopeptide (TPR) repeat protein
MSTRTDERSFESLRRRAERAIDEGQARRVVEPLLERILKMAPEGHPCRVFAHRHLAELRLEEDPWAAALHLRKVVNASPHDDVSHSLMALAQALLGNYRSAVASYRRALSLAPRNPWYHHNLGHLLDVALDDPKSALPHLEVALEHADPPEHEITASVAHCLARVGRITRARELAEQALRSAPQNRDHRSLLSWIEQGAPAGMAMGAARAHDRARAPQMEARPRVEEETLSEDAVTFMLIEQLKAEGFSQDQLDGALSLYQDYRELREPMLRKPEITAAAVHYAIALVYRVKSSQTAVARRYGVTAKSLSLRYADIRAALAIVPEDPRYAP